MKTKYSQPSSFSEPLVSSRSRQAKTFYWCSLDVISSYLSIGMFYNVWWNPTYKGAIWNCIWLIHSILHLSLFWSRHKFFERQICLSYWVHWLLWGMETKHGSIYATFYWSENSLSWWKSRQCNLPYWARQHQVKSSVCCTGLVLPLNKNSDKALKSCRSQVKKTYCT